MSTRPPTARCSATTTSTRRAEDLSTNSIATIFAWTGALRKRGELDGTPELTRFARNIEAAVVETIEAGQVTKDLALIADPKPSGWLDTEGFIRAIAERLRARVAAEAAGAR